MPLYKVRVTVPATYTADIIADSEEEAGLEACNQAVLPHIGDEWEEDGEAEISSVEKMAEDGEYDTDDYE